MNRIEIDIPDRIEIGLMRSDGKALHKRYRVRIFKEDFSRQKEEYVNNIPLVIALQLEEDLGVITQIVIYKNDGVFAKDPLTCPRSIRSSDLKAEFAKGNLQISSSIFNELFLDKES